MSYGLNHENLKTKQNVRRFREGCRTERKEGAIGRSGEERKGEERKGGERGEERKGEERRGKERGGEGRRGEERKEITLLAL